MTITQIRPETAGEQDHDERAGPPAVPPRRWWQRRTPVHRAVELYQERDAAKATIDIQDDPALVGALTPQEIRRRQSDARAVRAAQAEHQRRSELAATRRQARDQATDDELAAIKAADRVDAARASAQCRRLTEPGARLAGLYRTQQRVTRILLGVAVAGIAWSAVNVHNSVSDGLPATDPLWWLSYLVEPLISIPLVVLLILRGVAAKHGKTFGDWRVHLLEGGLLILTGTLNISGVNAGEVNFGTVLGHAIPPLMVALSVLLYAPIATYLGDLLAQAYEDAAAASRPSHLTDDETKWSRRIGQALAGIHAGDLPLGDNRLPSTNQVERYLRTTGSIAKADAQRVAEAIREMFPNGIAA